MAKATRAAQKSLALESLEPVDALPPKQSTQRNSALKKIADQLRENPGQWYKIAQGKRQSAYQKRARLKGHGKETGATFEVEVRNMEADGTALPEGISNVFARYVKTELADGTSA